MSTTNYHIYPCGDHALTIELGDRIDAGVNEKVISLFHYLQQARINGVQDIIPSYHTVTLVYDTALLKKQHPASCVYDMMYGQLQNAANTFSQNILTSSQVINIPVCYDPSLAPDIDSLAALQGLGKEEVIALHTAKTYRVYMIGFLPGFAYMGTVDEKIATPRKIKPRAQVPAGSVGIAGEQTGIYPFDSPGGWQLIGQTPFQMFSVAKQNPCYLQSGDEVRFYAISVAEFTKLKNT